MAPTDREERRRMRQRGAGAGAVTSGNFGFTFGGSAPAFPQQPSSRGTPKALPAQRSTRRTPAPLPPSASSRRTPAAPRSASAEPSNLQKSASAQRSAKTKTPRQAGEEALLATPSVQGALEAPDENQEDELEGNDEEYQTSARKSQAEPAPPPSVERRAVATPRVAMEEAEDELEQDDEDHALSTARKSRASLELDRRTASPAESAKKRRGRPRKSLPDPVAEPSPAARASDQQAQVELPIHKKRGRPRKSDASVVAQSTVEETPKKAGRGRPRKSGSAVKPVASPSTQGRQDRSEDGWDGLPPAQKQPASAKARKRTSFRSTQDEAEEQDEEGDELDEDEDEEQEEEEPENENEAEETDDELQDDQSRQSSVEMQHEARPPAPKPKPTKRKAAQDGAPRKRQRRTTDIAATTPRIPITVYRLSYPRRAVANDDEDASEDELAPAHPIMRAPAINPIDVLAQVTAEMTARAATSLMQQSQTEPLKPKRSELKRRAKTAQAFGAALADRLFDLTEAVNAGETLKSRLKAADKEKAALRARFLDLRRQREEVALRMDESGGRAAE
ncbi:uncharacterized protein K452DRAFT_359443 [Aplosporella prunicola CBS 121167]|uniref:Inner kinetochore subunit AME1 domain-containing protein n=1 Tax=Aplosporella prunicola CBS 121167 TaxID=1176127 RepID=A0A6A6BCV2_9PEZI|nr:uncharacterized protein K452DRAFT_359443 [Aplosporella prunicola CBS 121167]KAF2141044.1 hypothetical protein K452DRAFT_359443 [Aplosporella prunicola CBS 121167]